jgi:hypothetical protein
MELGNYFESLGFHGIPCTCVRALWVLNCDEITDFKWILLAHQDRQKV